MASHVIGLNTMKIKSLHCDIPGCRSKDNAQEHEYFNKYRIDLCELHSEELQKAAALSDETNKSKSLEKFISNSIDLNISA